MLLLWLPKWHRGKESACQCRRRKRHGFDPWVGKLPWRRNGNTPVFLPGKSHGPRGLAGYSPLGCKESDTTEPLHFTSPYTGLPRWLSSKESTCQCRRHGVQCLGQEDPLQKETATHSSTPAWKIPWTEELGGLWSMGSQRVGHD